MQDPVVVEHVRIAWTEGKAIGFIPSSIFIKDESGNLIHDDEVLFLQEFGFRDVAWWSIDEWPFPEATEADFYDARGLFGRWNRLQYVENPPKEPRPADIQAMLGEAGLGLPEAPPGPALKLVPDWTSVITYDDYMAERKRERERAEKRRLQRRVKELCHECARGADVFKDLGSYYHRKELGADECPAHVEHLFLRTKADELVDPSKKKAYRLLRGYLEHDNRFVSSRKIIRSHSAYRKLLELGSEAIPFILQDLREGQIGGIWTAEILAELTGKRGGDPAWWLALAERETESQENG